MNAGETCEPQQSLWRLPEGGNGCPRGLRQVRGGSWRTQAGNRPECVEDNMMEMIRVPKMGMMIDQERIKAMTS